jgi:hypothetical protein
MGLVIFFQPINHQQQQQQATSKTAGIAYPYFLYA